MIEASIPIIKEIIPIRTKIKPKANINLADNFCAKFQTSIFFIDLGVL